MGAERLGRYSVLKHLASGGMADVLLGRTDGIEGFERHVVLKRIRAEHAKDQRFISMFLDEARVAASLHHQNIVQVYDIGEENGAYFFAMEYLHGEDLRRLLSKVSKTRAHMPIGYVVAIVSAAAAGLHYAHERKSNDKKSLQIVHRDVSPSNIFIGYDGAVKVVDFGIAKARTRQVETQTGSLKGKVSYMSPEQCRGEEIDRRSDVYALGVLLYELATTTRLFKGDNDYLLMDAIVNGRVPLPRVRRPDLPNDLSMIILRALSVDKARRYQTADELRVDLEQFAINANLTTTTSSLATYMRKMFGEKPEPWTYDGPIKTGTSGVDVDGPTAAAGASLTSWTDEFALSPEESAPPHAIDKTQSERKPQPRKSARNIALSDTVAPPTPRDTRSSMGLGWERMPTAPRSHRLLWFSLPIVLTVAGLGVWQFVLKPQQATTSASATQPQTVSMTPTVAPQAPAPVPGPTIEPIGTPEPAAVRVAEPEPAAAPVEPPAADPVAAAPEPEPAPIATKKTHAAPARRAPTRKEPERVVAAVAAPAPAPAPVVVTPPPAPAPTPAPAPVPVPAVAKQPEPPKEIELTISSLSNATVSAVASDNSRSLAKCEGGAELHGDVAVSFQIDGTGRVIKSQLSSSIKNPKVAGCVLKAVQSWKFPKPPSGAAKGVYTISYQ